jgi:LacI family transcriptional regulator
VNNKRVTSFDVAELAGVSRSTVSFVFSEDKQSRIRPETRQKVREAAEKLGYYPNASARALASNQSNTIGLIMTRSPRYIASDNFLPQIIGGLLDIVKQEQLELLIDWVEPGQQIQTYLQLSQAKHIDGMIILTPRFDDLGLNALEQLDIPCVLMGQIPECNLPYVDIDNRASAKLAVDYLIELGHRQIACITNAATAYSSAGQRLEGYRDALKAADIALDERLIRMADFDAASGYSQMKDLLTEYPRFSAVFVASDNVALGALAAIHDAGLSVPEDISLVGFDDIPEAAFYYPKLTTVHTPAKEIAEESCHLLMQLLKGEIPLSRTINIPTELIIRDSARMIERSYITTY